MISISNHAPLLYDIINFLTFKSSLLPTCCRVATDESESTQKQVNGLLKTLSHWTESSASLCNHVGKSKPHRSCSPDCRLRLGDPGKNRRREALGAPPFELC